MLAWTKQNTMQKAMRTVLKWPQSHATRKTINMITNKYEPQQKRRLGTYSFQHILKDKKTLPHLNAHVVNRQLQRNRKYIPKFSSGKNKIKFLKNVTLKIPNLILPTRMLNIFPIGCNVNFETVISALNNTKRTENVTLDDIGDILLVNLPRQNLKSGGLNL